MKQNSETVTKSSPWRVCDEFKNVIKYSGARIMTIESYRKYRRRKHRLNPDVWSELTVQDEKIIQSLVGRSYLKLSFSYRYNAFGKLERVYFVNSK